MWDIFYHPNRYSDCDDGIHEAHSYDLTTLKQAPVFKLGTLPAAAAS